MKLPLTAAHLFYLALAALGLPGSGLAQSSQPAPMPPPPQVLPAEAPPNTVPARKADCSDCGVVQSITQRKEKGKGSAVGTVGGAVVGGLIGRELIGGGLGTVGGAVAGGVAGKQIERNVKKRTVWDVVVRLPNGKTQTVKLTSRPTVAVGERVRVAPGRVTRV